MTVYALRLDNGVDTAVRVRMADMLALPPGSAPLTSRSALRPDGGGVVAVVAGSMTVTVQPFMAWVQGGVSVAQGGYPVVSDTQVTLTIAAGDATRARIDTIAAVVRDNAYDGSGSLDARVIVVAGTPGSGTAPALPTNCVPLRDVLVPAGLSAGSGGLSGSNLSTDRRAYLGQTVWTPAPLVVGTDYGSGYTGVQYRRLGDNVELRGALGGLGGGLSSGATVFTLPVGFRPTGNEAFPVCGNGLFNQINVLSTGVVTVQNAIAVGGNVEFSGIRFSTL